MESKVNRHFYRPDIDGLRAFAVLLVLGFHAYPQWINGGFIGVDIFFVISGFLITGILLKHLRREDFSFARFYTARIRRIFPALLLVLAFSLIFAWFILMPDEFEHLGKHIVGGAAFVSNFLLWQEAGYFDISSQKKPLLHLWSLGIEQQFYLVWPLLVWGASRFRKYFYILPILVGSASLAVNLFAGLSASADFYLPVTRFWELMAGGLLAQSPHVLLSHRLHKWWSNTASFAGLVLILFSVFLFHSYQIYPGWRALLPVSGSILIIAAGPNALINRLLLSSRLVVSIGLISYPLYLWHWPLLSFTKILWGNADMPVLLPAAVVSISFVLAVLTYLYVECRVKALASNHVVVWTLILAMILTGVFGCFVVIEKGFPSRKSIQGYTAMRFDVVANDALAHQYRPASCQQTDGGIPLDLLKECSRFGDMQAPHTIVLWGDSHAGSWAPVFYAIAKKFPTWRVFVFRYGACPPIVDVRQSTASESCYDIHRAAITLQTIQNLHPDYVVLISFWQRYINGAPVQQGTSDPEDSRLTTSPTEHATSETSKAAFAEKLPETVNRLAAHSHVIIFKEMPLMNVWVNDSIDRLPWLHRKLLPPEPSLAQHRARTEFVNQIIDDLGHRPNVSIFDPTPYVCDDVCHMRRGDIVLYSDDNHISAPGALSFMPQILPLLGLH